MKRDLNQAIFGGVCSGIANYLNIDLTLVRLVFVLMAATGISIFLYFILLLSMPIE